MRRRVRRHSEPDHPNHERWLVSYADFITLLFAFFVVMYAISTLNEGKYRVVSDSLMQAFRSDPVVTAQSTGLAPVNGAAAPVVARRQQPRVLTPMKRAEEQKLVHLADRIQEALRPLVQSGQVRLTRLPHGLAVEISASVLFAPAQAALNPDSMAGLTAVAAVIADADNPIHIEGHTDNVPISTPQYPSNWELSAARASSVVRLFEAAGVAPRRLTAIGYGANRPLGPNDGVEQRARNRRVTLLILGHQESEDRHQIPGTELAPSAQ